jgi:sec-independent protein translocase protein TatA
MELGVPELLIVLIIIILIFGVGRISKIGGELGQGIQAFRSGLQTDKEPPAAPIQPQAETNLPTNKDAEMIL